MEMQQYLSMFIEESKEHLQAINENLLLLENEPENIAIVQEIFRSAHTIKGMAATMGFEDMASLTHEMENVLDRIRSKKLVASSVVMDVIFQSVDILESILLSIVDGGDGKYVVKDIIGNLRNAGTANLEVAASISEDIKPANKAPLKQIVFNPYELTIVKQSQSTGYFVYQIDVTISNDCVLKAARTYMVVNTLENYGEMIRTDPSIEELEQENFDELFTIILISKNSKEEIEKAILNISEIDSVLIQLVDDTNTLLEVQEQQAEEAFAPSEEDKKKQADHKLLQKKIVGGKTIRVDIERLDILMNLFSELVIDRGRLEQLARELGQPALVETVEHMSRISGDLQNIVLNMRMVPVDQVFNRFPRMVRDLAKELNKKIDLVIEGAETELDRTVIDEIGDPLVHLLRNSVDHGIETIEERRKVHKSETGTVELKAYHSGNHVFIEVKDDGRGVNREKVLKKAIENKIIVEQQSPSMTDSQVFDLLFASGFSTAEKISDISGRGVGLDVVRSKIESLGGSVSVDSQFGKGTAFLIQLPLTLSIISAMLVQVKEEKYAVPLSSIIETAIIKQEQIMRAHNQDVIDFRGKIVPLVYMKNIFQIPGGTKGNNEEIPVLIVRKSEKMAGLVVDSFIGQQEIVLKSLGKYLVNTFAISGATILGDGQVALIIDCNALIK